jgi:3-phosphoshikimate 1-carboxyvinyltransferase
MSMRYPPQLQITHRTEIPRASVRVPGSKSITNRALVLAALHSEESLCTLENVLQSEDTEVMLSALKSLGFTVREEWSHQRILIGRDRDLIPALQADLFVANSGTTMRFLTAMLALGRGRYRLDGVPRMRERPIRDLLDAMKQLGVVAISETDNGCPPVVIQANGLRGGSIEMRADISSQFLSGLLMAAPFAQAPIQIELVGPVVSEPYIEMTLSMMRTWGDSVRQIGRKFEIEPRRTAPLLHYQIEPDASAASYFFGLAAITDGSITVEGFGQTSLQGDLDFIFALEKMGCRLERSGAGVTVHGGPLKGIDLDMNAISDTVMTLGVVACFAEGPTRIRNVAHIRHKETDRITALANELRKIGAEVTEFEDGLEIIPRPLHGAVIETYRDHRMAMSLALVGWKIPGIIIDDPGCVAKTYPRFWDDLAAVAAMPSSP